MLQRRGVLVVDGAQSERDRMTRLLNPSGFVTFPAANVQEARDVLEESPVPIQAAVIALALPGTTGLDVLARLRITCPSLPCLILGDGSENHTPASFFAYGAHAYLQKPFPAGHLLAMVTDLVRRARPASRRAAVAAGGLNFQILPKLTGACQKPAGKGVGAAPARAARLVDQCGNRAPHIVQEPLQTSR